MIKSFFKTAFRNLRKNKGHSFLNILGLSVGIACAGLIFLWVEDETNWDNVHEKKDRLYYVRENQKYDTYTATFGSTPGVLAPAMQEEIPGIANTCRTTEGNTRFLFTIGNRSLYASGKYAEPSIFSMLSLPFVEGDPKNAFSQLHSLVITEGTAKKFFDTDKDIVGKTIRMDNSQDYVVSGVVKDIPKNSSFQFEWLAPFKIWYDESPWAHRWGNNCLSTYVELEQGTAVADVNSKLYDFIQKKLEEANGSSNAISSVARPFLWSMNDWRLYDQFDNGKATGGGRIEYIRLFSVIAWIILLIACINFMNLATARSEKRAKEVGVRKVLGSGKRRLVAGFIGEALVMSVFATIGAMIIMVLIFPLFNGLVQKNLSLNLGTTGHILFLLGIALICGLVAGSYPALYLSSFNPVFVLKGLKLKTGSAAFIRKALVVVQFSASIVLIIGTIIIYQQIQHVKNRQLGFDRNNLIEMDVQGDMARNYPIIKQELLGTGLIDNIALSDHKTITSGNNTGSLTWDGKQTDARILISTRYVTHEFMSTSGIKVLEGRDFQPGDSVGSKTPNVLITQSFEKLMGNGSAVGKRIRRESDTTGSYAVVVGVVNDYVYGDMYGNSDPVVFLSLPPKYAEVMYVRIKERANIEEALSRIQDVMKTNNPAYPFEYRFVDDEFNQKFLNEMLVSRLSRVFAALAILISCLGLFGLATYTAERRIKEIGIRKVLGASVAGITRLLSFDFLKLIVISAIIAFPLAWWLMYNWLQDYQYRITISWWVFGLAGALAMLIALFTISFQSVKAAIASPIKNLRTE